MQPKTDQKKPTVLIVDDQVYNIEMLNQVLQDDYRVLFATNGLSALEQVEDHKPDLILLDVVMQGIDGYQVCSILQSDPITQNIPIVFITSMTDEKYETTGLKMGAVDYITKPFDPKMVLDKVRHHLGDTGQPS